MTLAEYENASRVRRVGYRAYRNPLLMLLVGPSLVFLFERRFPQRGMSRRILFSVVVTNLALAGWAIGWSALVGWQTFLLIQGTTLVAGGAIAAWIWAAGPTGGITIPPPIVSRASGTNPPPGHDEYGPGRSPRRSAPGLPRPLHDVDSACVSAAGASNDGHRGNAPSLWGRRLTLQVARAAAVGDAGA